MDAEPVSAASGSRDVNFSSEAKKNATHAHGSHRNGSGLVRRVPLAAGRGRRTVVSEPPRAGAGPKVSWPALEDTGIVRAPAPRPWAFPRNRPQLYAESARALAAAAAYYAFARPEPRWRRRAAAAAAAIPVARRLVATRAPFELPCGAEVWGRLVAGLGGAVGRPRQWAYFRSPWSADRFGAFPLDGRGRVPAFVRVGRSLPGFAPETRTGAPFRVPRVLAEAAAGGWQARALQALPRFHAAPVLDAAALRRVAAAIAEVTPPGQRPAGRTGWVAIHGDLTPWNLRQADGGLWLLDWERCGWGPSDADELYYRLAELSLSTAGAAELGAAAAAALPGRDLEDAARFWLGHPAFTGEAREPETVGERTDVERVATVAGALARLAGGQA